MQPVFTASQLSCLCLSTVASSKAVCPTSTENALCFHLTPLPTYLVYLIQQCWIFCCCAAVYQVLLERSHQGVEAAATLHQQAVPRSTLQHHKWTQ